LSFVIHHSAEIQFAKRPISTSGRSEAEWKWSVSMDERFLSTFLELSKAVSATVSQRKERIELSDYIQKKLTSLS
jgi:hypothetical protein